jgi:putative ABC transport system ATP-binding protein
VALAAALGAAAASPHGCSAAVVASAVGAASVAAGADMPPRPVIDLRDARKTYHLGEISVHALRGVTMSVQRGDYLAIMGSSGSGKTTLMNILGCLDSPTSGEYRLDGLDVGAADQDELADLRCRFIGFVFQSFNLIPRTRALANVELPLAYARLSRSERRARALRALDEVGLGDRVHHLPSELSGGQQQRVAIARALVTNPAMILADEPTGNLDNRSTEEVLALFERLHDEGRTVILITHENEVAAHARRVIRFSDGRIVADESIDHQTPARDHERADQIEQLRDADTDDDSREPSEGRAA